MDDPGLSCGSSSGLDGIRDGTGTQLDLSLKGKSQALDGQKFKFEADGQMTWEPEAGVISFIATTDVGIVFTGMAVMGSGTKRAFATTTFYSGAAKGKAVFYGKSKKQNT